MQKFSTLQDAIRLAEFAHFNQIDKAGLPYIEHPKRVLVKVQSQGGLPYVQIGAILHDIVEDTTFTIEMLEDLGFSEAAVQVVDLVTRKPYVRMRDYYDAIRSNPGAKMIKLADIEDNLSPWRLNYLTEKTRNKLICKYDLAKRVLDVGSDNVSDPRLLV